MNPDIYNIMSRTQAGLLHYSNRYRANLEIGELATDSKLTVWFTEPRQIENDARVTVTYDKVAKQFKISGTITTVEVDLMTTTPPSVIANFNYVLSNHYQTLRKTLTCGDNMVGDVEYTTTVSSINQHTHLKHVVQVTALASLPFPQMEYLDIPDIEYRDSYVLRHAILTLLHEQIHPNAFNEYHELIKHKVGDVK